MRHDTTLLLILLSTLVSGCAGGRYEGPGLNLLDVRGYYRSTDNSGRPIDPKKLVEMRARCENLANASVEEPMAQYSVTQDGHDLLITEESDFGIPRRRRDGFSEGVVTCHALFRGAH